MSEDIPLQVVYQKIETKDDEVSLKEVKSGVELEDSCCKEEKCCKEEEKEECCKEEKCKKGRRFCRSACACFGCFTFIMMLVYAVIVLSISVKVYMNVHQCFHSKENVYKESSIVDRHINQIHINVVTGFVNIEFEKREDIFIRVWDNARSRAHVESDTFDSGVAINNTAIIVHSVSPAFTLKSCHHAKIQIYIPEDYPQELLISGNVKVGMMHIDGKNKKNVNIDVNVDLGKIVVEDIKSNYLSLTSEIGLIKVYDTVAQNTKISSHVGIIRTYDLSSKNINVNTQFGCSKHYNLYAEVANINTRFGFSTVKNPSPIINETEPVHLDFHMNTEYGKAKVVLNSPSNLNFNIGNTKGKMKVEYEEKDWVCMVKKSSQTLTDGRCGVKGLWGHFPSTNTVNLDMNTKYGKATMILVDTSKDQDE